jgi:actin-related protein
MTNISHVVAVDAGSSEIRVGRCGEDNVDFTVPSIVTRIDDKTCIPYQKDTDATNLEFVIECGMIQDFDAFEVLMRSIPTFAEGTEIDAGRCILMSQKPRTPIVQIQQLTEFAFETLQLSYFHITNQAVTDAYSAGVFSGTVVEFSDGSFTLAAIEEGMYMYDARIQVHGMRHNYRKLMEHINKRNSIQLDIINPQDVWLIDSLQSNFFVSHINDSSYHEEESYELPDGRTVIIDNSQWSAGGDLMFLGNDSIQGFRTCLNEINDKLPYDVGCRYQIIMRGGASVLKGFHNRVRVEWEQVVKSHNIRQTNYHPEQSSTFMGMSILGSLSSFTNTPIQSKQYYEEHGFNQISLE